MIWLVESPWPAITAGTIALLVLLTLLVRTGRVVFLAVAGATLLLTLGMVALERFIVTETEEVAAALDRVAAALEANDAPAVLAGFTPNCPRLGEVRSALERFTVSDARVGGDLRVRLNRLTIPPSATTYFTGRIAGRDKRGAIPYETMLRRFKVTLHRHGDRWLVADYSDLQPGSRQEP